MADYEYQLDGELIVIPVHLFGKTTNYSGMFVLDTGSSGIVIDHRGKSPQWSKTAGTHLIGDKDD